MSKYADENVLVVPRELFDELGAFEGFSDQVAHYLPPILDPVNNFFLARDKAEDDPTHKQIIPYAIFHHGNEVLRYFRGGGSGEKRLASKGSIGIGGHVNDCDFQAASLDRDTYNVGFEREIEEELDIDGSFSHQIVGLINDDSNEVGQVHLGVVHLVSLDTKSVKPAEDNIDQLDFLSIDQLKAEIDGLETWSSICVDQLGLFLDC